MQNHYIPKGKHLTIGARRNIEIWLGKGKLNQEIVTKLLDYSQKLREHYELYQLLLFHFQERQTEHFFDLINEALPMVNPIFQTVFRTFLKDKDKIVDSLELPYSNAKLEATNNLIKVIKRNAFGFRKMTSLKEGF